MADASAALRITNPQTIDQFRMMLEQLDVPAPWELDSQDPGMINDAIGAHVLTVDEPRDRSDDDAQGIALAIILAVNTCAGFKAVAHG